MRISIFRKVLASYATTTQSISSYVNDVGASTYKLSGSKLKLQFFNAPIILKNVKFYKWSINVQTLNDMGIYSKSDDKDFNFQSEFNSGYYSHFINDNIEISDSNNACKRWGNGRYEVSNGEEWDDNNSNSGDWWSNTCTKEFAWKWVNTPFQTSFWYPNWGDSIRDTTPLVEVWDDGNNMSGDGWSSSCQIEAGYSWVHPSGGADTWTTPYTRPVVTSSSIDIVKSQIIVVFDQAMLNQTIDDYDMALSITGPNSPYSVSWLTYFDKNQLIVSFTSSPIIVGGSGETVSLTLIKIDSFKSEHLIPILSSKVFSFTLPKTEPNKSTQSSGAGASYTFVITILVSIGVSLLTGGSMELMWGLTNTLQILFYYGMLNLVSHQIFRLCLVS